MPPARTTTSPLRGSTRLLRAARRSRCALPSPRGHATTTRTSGYFASEHCPRSISYDSHGALSPPVSGSFLNIDTWKVRNKISTAVRVDILAGLLYLFSRTKERVKRCGRDELPASSTAGQGRAGAEFVCECAVGPGTPPSKRLPDVLCESGSSKECSYVSKFNPIRPPAHLAPGARPFSEEASHSGRYTTGGPLRQIRRRELSCVQHGTCGRDPRRQTSFPS